ncbi:MAG: hypothetical protein A3B30_00655 [Candidatus Komeilibacteria bacterium RIFCSPLOWO2_01_FULL_52_15]|uniref:DUF4870 domain-containing protein n=2 Tax=Candidatus Komeiliibacteriota TaxID=1817908 RepID=A0A1G2BQ30_9BACT|nr:MAG: hypothetical protein A2677_03095 [Candidatus Komeilibacteria bacterium RIFCSPHIGHO2_01_FULL_52_14]OGY91211.1 MAG: hypothetical protein A3B30_00655 [Candidatus Komeilibacteria bacterium RIFCSPLOWO2_01_FULL_52_15]
MNNKERVVSAPEQERYTAALSYVWILCLYPLLFKKNSAFIQFHAKQGLALFILEIISFLFLVFAPLVIIICVILSILGVKAAIAGRYWKLPVIGDWVKKLGI